jgi:hypothetical protein
MKNVNCHHIQKLFWIAIIAVLLVKFYTVSPHGKGLTIFVSSIIITSVLKNQEKVDEDRHPLS